VLNNEQNADLVKNCLKVTDWDINEKENCIGLPKKTVWSDEKNAPDGWDNLPCHQVDHNPYYTEEVSKDLKRLVWDPSIRAAKKCQFDPEDVKSLLEEASDFWRGELLDRGEREGGTKYCWKHRKRLRNSWYMPFSMASEPIKRSPPPEQFSGTMAEYLKAIFKVI
jgi:hypothetical protein